MVAASLSARTHSALVALVLVAHTASWYELHRAGLVTTSALVAAVAVTAGAAVGGRASTGGRGRGRVVGVLAALVLVAATAVDLVDVEWNANGVLEQRPALAHLLMIVGAALAWSWSSAGVRHLALAATLAGFGVVVLLPGYGPPWPSLLVWLAATGGVLAIDAATSGEQKVPLQTGRPLRPSFGRSSARAFAALSIVALVSPLAAALAEPGGGGRSAESFRRPVEGDDGDSGGVSSPLGFGDDLDTSLRFDPGDAVVLRVAAAAPDYLRGRGYTTWDGRSWSTGRTRVVPLVALDGVAAVDTSSVLNGPTWPVVVERFDQTITVKASGLDVAVGARTMERVALPGAARQDLVDGSVQMVEPFRVGDAYHVTSYRPVVTAATLRLHDPLAAGGRVLGDPALEPFLALPEVPSRVSELASSITGSAPTTYDKVRAIERWMGEHVEYSLDTPPLAPGRDAVDQFLFEDRVGFCTQIASAMAVLLRTLGVPTRVVAGFVLDERDGLTGEFVVRSHDAHAWVEVLFPGIGWQAFDPTASVPLSGESGRSLSERLGDVVTALRWVAAGVVGIGVLAWAAIALLRRRRPRVAPSYASVVAGGLAGAGRRAGRARRPHETLDEYARALVGSVIPDSRLLAIARDATESAFSSRPRARDEAACVVRDVRRIARQHRKR